jgi:hypothetical protein
VRTITETPPPQATLFLAKDPTPRSARTFAAQAAEVGDHYDAQVEF